MSNRMNYNYLMEKAIKDSQASGNHFFDKDTMKFWNSKVEAGMYDNDTFVTSEDNYNRTKKLYTVRKYDWNNHSVEDVSGFQQFSKLADAIEFALEYKED